MSRRKRHHNNSSAKHNRRPVVNNEQSQLNAAPAPALNLATVSTTTATATTATDNDTGISSSFIGAANQAPTVVPGRQTQPTNVNPLGLLSYSFLPRRQYLNVDLNALANNPNINSQQLLELFADLSPEVSLAVWNMLRMVNGGWKFKVMTKNGKREIARGKEALDELIDRINPDYGGLDTIIDAWTMTAYLQGAIAGEIALTEDLSDIDDIYPVQPWSIHFERDGLTQKLIPFQQQVQAANIGPVQAALDSANGYGVAGYPYKRLNPVTFGYLPVDAPPDDPYGRAPAASVLQLLAFDLQLLKDIRQATHMNAFGRLEIKLVEEAILKNAPKEVQSDPTGAKKRLYIKEYLDAFRTSYNLLKPDDAIVHTDSVELDTIDFSGKTVAADVIIRMLERRIIRALKQLPVLMGSNEGTTETHGTVQMDIYAKGIKSFQRKIARLLEKLLGVALQVLGIANAKVVWEFEEVRANDRLKDIQGDQLLANLLAFYRDQGWITNDDASIQATGSKAVADPKPPVVPNQGQGQGQQPADSQEKDPGETTDEEADKAAKGQQAKNKKKQGQNPDDKESDDNDQED